MSGQTLAEQPRDARGRFEKYRFSAVASDLEALDPWVHPPRFGSVEEVMVFCTEREVPVWAVENMMAWYAQNRGSVVAAEADARTRQWQRAYDATHPCPRGPFAHRRWESDRAAAAKDMASQIRRDVNAAVPARMTPADARVLVAALKAVDLCGSQGFDMEMTQFMGVRVETPDGTDTVGHLVARYGASRYEKPVLSDPDYAVALSVRRAAGEGLAEIAAEAEKVTREVQKQARAAAQSAEQARRVAQEFWDRLPVEQRAARKADAKAQFKADFVRGATASLLLQLNK